MPDVLDFDYHCNCGYYVEGTEWTDGVACPMCGNADWSNVESIKQVGINIDQLEKDVSRLKEELEDHQIDIDVITKKYKKKFTGEKLEQKLKQHRTKSLKITVEVHKKLSTTELTWIKAREKLLKRNELKLNAQRVFTVHETLSDDIDQVRNPEQLAEKKLEANICDLEKKIRSLKTQLQEQVERAANDVKQSEYDLIEIETEILLDPVTKISEDPNMTSAELSTIKDDLEEFQTSYTTDCDYTKKEEELKTIAKRIENLQNDALSAAVENEVLIRESEINQITETLQKCKLEKQSTELNLLKQILPKENALNETRKMLQRKYERRYENLQKESGESCCSIL